MLRNKCRAWREISKLVSLMNNLNQNDSLALKYFLFLYYQQLQDSLNGCAQKFYQKRANNPHSKPWVNSNFTPSEKDVDSKKFTCKADINYPDLDYVHQQRIFDCGDACMEMIANYQLKKSLQFPELADNETIKAFHQNLYKMNLSFFSGSDTGELTKYSDGLIATNCKDYKDAMTIDSLAFYLFESGPIVVATKEIGGHFVVVKGIVNGQVLIHDPWSGPNLTYSFEAFKNEWSGSLIYFLGGYSKYKELELSKNSNVLRMSS